ncbi:MAG: hypothetical protein AB4060_12650 [Crocosphaera sp.]
MKQNKGFGEPKKTVSIKLIEREQVTDEGLIDLIEEYNLKWFAKVTKNGITQQCGLIPFNNSKTKKTKISVHMVFSRPFNVILTQQEIDKLSTKVTKQILKEADVIIT